MYNQKKFKSQCKRKVFPSPEGRKVHSKNFWDNLFHVFDTHAKIPWHHRKDILCETLDRRIITQIFGIVGYDKDIAKEYLRKIYADRIDMNKKIDPNADEPFKRIIAAADNYSDDLEHECDHSGASNEKRIERSSIPTEQSFHKRLKKQTKGVERPHCIGHENPYLNFFKTPPERAAIWREMPPLKDYELISLRNRTDAIVRKIASDFLNWYICLFDIGEGDFCQYTVEGLAKLFASSQLCPLETSVQLRIKQMQAVPTALAERCNLPHRSVRNCLHHEIEKDSRAINLKKSSIVFGSSRPLHYFNPGQDLASKWLKCDKEDSDIVTMKNVWDGITDLRSTKGFCEYLMEHQEIEPPKYLQNIGMYKIFENPISSENESLVEIKALRKTLVLKPGEDLQQIYAARTYLPD